MGKVLKYIVVGIVCVIAGGLAQTVFDNSPSVVWACGMFTGMFYWCSVDYIGSHSRTKPDTSPKSSTDNRIDFKQLNNK